MKLVENILRQLRDLNTQVRGLSLSPDASDVLMEELQTVAFTIRAAARSPAPVAQMYSSTNYNWQCAKCAHANISLFIGTVPKQLDCQSCNTMHKTKVMK